MRQCRPFFERAGELSVPMIVHYGVSVDPNADLRMADPLDLSPVARDFPEVTFVIAHFGAGYLGNVLKLAYQYPNICVDSSGTNNWMDFMPYPMTLAQVFETCVTALGPERILFGTDANTMGPYREWIAYPAAAHARGDRALGWGSRPDLARQCRADLRARRPGAGRRGRWMSDRYGGAYDSIVRWDKRLAREAPFFQELFAKRGVTSLADVGCGTAKHAILFSTWDIEVWALDPSEEMLEGARENALEAGANIHFALAGFGEVAATSGQVDAAVSLGNALPHVGDLEGLRIALADLAEAIRPGGLLVVHMLNHDRLDAQGLRLLPSVMRSGEAGDTVTVKAIDHAEDHYVFEFVRLTRPNRPAGLGDDEPSEWAAVSSRSRHTKILGKTMRAELASAGFGEIDVFGNHSGKPLDVAEDESAIWVATRV